MQLVQSNTSELNLWYLDDNPIGGELRDLLHDLDTVRRVASTIDLLLNEDKCEILPNDYRVVGDFMPNIMHTRGNGTLLLGAQIGDQSVIHNMLHSTLTVIQCSASHQKRSGVGTGLDRQHWPKRENIENNRPIDVLTSLNYKCLDRPIKSS
jgi:hypothetical protein